MWPNSTLLERDIVYAVRKLKARVEGVLTIIDSGKLIGSLMSADLIDEYLLMMHPVVLGSGQRFFPEHVHSLPQLVESMAMTTGIVSSIYEPA